MFEQGLPEKFRKPKGWLWKQFTGVRGTALRIGTLRLHEKPLAHIIYIEGLSEFAEKTYELARDFNKMGCNFDVIDRHGQARSGRYLDADRQHSDGYEKDIADIINYRVREVPGDVPVVLLGHSTGGLLALLALEKEPDLFQAGIITAPLLGVKIDYVKNIEDVISRMPLPPSLLNRFVPGGRGWLPRRHPESSLKPEDFSSDPERMMVQDYWMERNKKLRTGSPTVGWLKEMCKAILRVRQPAFLQNVKQPTLWLSAGQEKLVDVKAIFSAVSNMKNAEHIHYKDSQHEILMERDEIRGDALSRAESFLKKHL